MMDDQLAQRIDDYLLDRLNSADRLAFEKELASNDELKQGVEEQRLILFGAEHFGDQLLRKQLKQIHQEEFGQPKRATLNSWRTYAAAAAILALGIVGWFMFQPSPSTSLFEAYYEPYPYAVSTRSGDQTDENLVQLAELYKAENYQEASKLLNQIDSQASSELNLVKGITLLEVEQLTDAKSAFQTLIDQGDVLYGDQARWYLALTFLKENKVEEASEALIPLVQNTNADQHEEASALLEKLKKQ